MYKITFKQSPNYWPDRNGYQPIALVNHRMVGYLPGTDATFANATNQVSAHFGIGYRVSGGHVEITQYVDLGDTAWTAGNYDPTGGWTLVKKNSSGTVINPNYYIVGIEHEDGGPNDGRVTDAIKQASAWLQTILLSGNVDLMRFVGIHINDSSTASALKAIVPQTETIIDHNRIAGIKKPYCWRPYKLDTGGFPAWQPTLLSILRSGTVAIQDTLALLDQQVTQIEQEKAAAEKARDDALAAVAGLTTKLTAAKTAAGSIQGAANTINSLAQQIIDL